VSEAGMPGTRREGATLHRALVGVCTQPTGELHGRTARDPAQHSGPGSSGPGQSEGPRRSVSHYERRDRGNCTEERIGPGH
jgi:hypothetical protein